MTEKNSNPNFSSDDEDQPQVKEANKPLEIVKNSTKGSVGEKGTVQNEKKKKKKNKAQTATKSSDQTTNETSKETTNEKLGKDIKSNQATNEMPITHSTTTKPEKKQNVPSNPKSNNVNGVIKKFNAKHKISKDLKKVAHKTIDKKKGSNGISDERLKAFGINPKKFAKKQKYGPKTAPQPGATTENSKNAQKGNAKNVQKAKFDSKLRNKLKKALKA